MTLIATGSSEVASELTCEVVLAAKYLARVALPDDVAQRVAEVLQLLARARLQRRQLLA